MKKKLLLLALALCGSALLHAEAPATAPSEFPLTLADIRVRDPFILPEGGIYYLYAQSGNRAHNDNGDFGVEVYKSCDLVHWSQPKQVFVRPKKGFWGNPPIWAPEVHKFDGAYYMFATFTGRDAGRGSQILCAESPEGPFVVVGDEANTPAEQTALDATPFIDPDGTHWMVYAHEWAQIKDGTYLAVKMKNDWSARIGEPVLLFKASKGPWVRAHPRADTFVTDGPVFHRMKNGKLVLIWSSFVKGHGYGMGQAISESGTLAGPWRHVEKPFFGGDGEDGGHAMIFRDFSGELLMALHQPNGGMPDYLKEKGVKFRTNDPVYLDYVKRWYQQVGEQLKGLMFKDGGPVIAVQLENEFEHALTSWGFKGEGGEEHMLHLKRLAIEAGLVAPYYVATAWESPVPAEEMMPAWGGYAWICPGGPTAWYLFNDMHCVKKGEFITPAHNHRIGVSYDATQVPVANIETGPGFFCYGQWRPNIPPESSEAIAMMMTARGGNLLGYYMYHGGTQFVGKRGNTGLMAFSYDFQGALREFGQTSPIYDYLKPANFFLEDFPELLAPTVVALPANPVTDKGNTTDLRYGARVNGESGFLSLNNYQDRVKMTEKKGLNINLAFKGKTLRIPEKGGFDLKPNQFAVLPFNLNLQGAHLDYALAQLYTRTKTDDGREVFVFFVPEGMDGHFVFDSDSLAELTAKSATVTKEGKRTTVAVQPGTDCVMQVKSKTGGQCEILTLTRQQALRLTRQDIFGRQRLVLSDSDVLSAEGKLRVSNIGHTKLDFAVFPAPKDKLATSAGAFANAGGVSDGVFRRYTIQVPEVKPDITFEGIGSNEVKVTAGPKAFDGAHDVFLEVIYMGNVAQLKQDGTLLAENLFNRTPWKIGLNRFREKLAKAPLEMNISPFAPIVEVVDNLQVNSGGVKMELPKSAMLVGNFQVTAPPADGKEKGFVSSISVLPEYAAWVTSENQSAPAH